jgi:hypothetical protein
MCPLRWRLASLEGCIVRDPAWNPPVILPVDLLQVHRSHPHVDALPSIGADQPRHVSPPLTVFVLLPGQEEDVPSSRLDADDRREPVLMTRHNSNMLASPLRRAGRPTLSRHQRPTVAGTRFRNGLPRISMTSARVGRSGLCPRCPDEADWTHPATEATGGSCGSSYSCSSDTRGHYGRQRGCSSWMNI